MFACKREGCAALTIPPGRLRQMLEHTLLTDSQLDAFCIDFFPTVYRQFTGGMDRTQKLNLLLTLAPPATLLEYLHSHTLEVPRPEQVGRRPIVSEHSSLRSSRWRRWGLSGLVVGGLLAAGLSRRPLRQPEHAGNPGPVVTGLAGSAAAPRPVAHPAPLLTSEPAGALIFADSNSAKLGQTPLSLEHLALSVLSPVSQLRVCLRAPGFIPVLVNLEPDSESFRSVHVRLQREPRAAQQRYPGQEDCHGPIPIIH